ncbi:MAG TPA: peptidyl-prolyl cis-trans isomerase [Polyangiaceae bacterium]|nr:peptidyl-prolyl cis-trans isomerase [Polyangiaceae bacterium]
MKRVPSLLREWRVAVALTSAGMSSVACQEGSAKPPAALVQSPLPAGTVARVGDEHIQVASIARISAAQQLLPKAALEQALSDALFAAEARRVSAAALVSTIERAALARSMLEAVADEAEAQGPPTDEEVRSVSAERWVDVDRPDSARVTHAVALHGSHGSSDAPRKLAERIVEATRGLRDATSFAAAARSVDAGTTQVRVEPLPFITADGRAMSQEGGGIRALQNTFDPTFAAAAARLRAPGDQSGVVETSFGYHVLLLEERLAAQQVPFEDRRVALRAEIVSRRAASSRRKLREQLGAARGVEISRDADALTALLQQPR